MTETSDYLQYGGGRIADGIDAQQTLEYLRGLGVTGGDLQQARESLRTRDDSRFVFEPTDSRYCDFCFARLMGGEYDQLKDGRDRCIRCSRTVLRTNGQFIELFQQARQNLEAAFDVRLRVPSMIRMVNAKEIARRTGEVFQPTPGVDARVLGFASKTHGGYSLFLENGSPKLAAIATVAHELTHIWQYSTWDEGALLGHYGQQRRLEIYEGMATWAQIQYLFFIKEFEFAKRHEAYALQRTDEYGVGLGLYLERYPLNRDGGVDQDTPFNNPLPL
ncbi:MAG TPA: hypothetical protein VN045_03380 [Microbacteriaceae bacterium]|jgi:hypothetical protein|nr:hypothetical protein [Microbacteriaceae bacterium]